MEPLVFVALIVLFSILDAVARQKRKGGAGGQGGPPPAPPRPREIEARLPGPEAERPSSYDDEPSFDDHATGEEAPPRPAAPAPSSSEGLIPADLWEEIAALARGERPGPAPKAPKPPSARPPTARPQPTARPRPMVKPRPAAPAPAEGMPIPVRPRTGEISLPPEVPAPEAPEHPLHGVHAGYGRPVRERPTRVGEPERARAGGGEAAAVRRMLREGPAPLRRAVILLEVLGPPSALRDDPFER